jgi:DNA-directed RNA polymerase subunit RPC12/RpoP
MRRWGTIYTLLGLAVLAVSLVFVYARIIRQPPRETTEVVVCTTCRHVFEVTFSMGRGGGPYVCPKCGNKTAYLAFQCRDPDCRAIFPVMPERMQRGEEIVCPVCGGPAGVLLRVPPDADKLVTVPAE